MLVCFRSPFRMEEVNETDFQLLENLLVTIDDEYYSVPRGFITDLGSVPRLPIAYLLTANKGRKSCVVHDWFYSQARFSRSMCDEILLHALKAEGVGIVARRLMYWGVRVGGARHFKS